MPVTLICSIPVRRATALRKDAPMKFFFSYTKSSYAPGIVKIKDLFIVDYTTLNTTQHVVAYVIDIYTTVKTTLT